MLVFKINYVAVASSIRREALRRAFSHWRKASGLDFREVIKPNEDVDIKISFERLNHTDGDYFDGKGKDWYVLDLQWPSNLQWPLN